MSELHDPANGETPATTPWWRRWWVVVAAVVLGIIIVAAVTADDEPDAGAAPTTTVTETTAAPDTTTTSTTSTTVAPATTVTTTRAPTTTSTSTTSTTTSSTTTTTAAPTTTVAEREPVFTGGTHLVGTDIEPGTYETGDLGSGCYWERLSGLSGDLDDIIANGIPDGHAIVEIDAGDEAFTASGCGGWYPLQPLDETLGEIPEGTWALDLQITAGRYRADPPDDTCYWERLSGFSGDLDDVITNDLPSGQAFVDIAAGDTGFRSSGCGMWTPVN